MDTTTLDNSTRGTVDPGNTGVPSYNGTPSPTPPTASATGSQAITPESLTSQPTVNLPQGSTNNSAADGLASTGSTTAKTVDSYIKSLTPAPTAADVQNQSILDSLASLTGQDTGRSQAQIDAENASGATQANKDLTALNNRLTLANAQYEKQFAIAGTQDGVTSATVTGQQGAIRRAQAADIGLITAQIQAKQGDLTLAKDTANRAVDAKYATIEDNIKVKQAQLAALQPTLNKQEKIQAQAQAQMLTDRANQVADEKQRAKDVAGLMVQYSKANIQPTDTLVQAAQKASAWQAQNPGAGKLQVIGSHTDDFGNKVDSYGFVNEQTGIVTPYSAPGSPTGDPTVGNTNFGLTTGTILGLPSYNTLANNPGVVRAVRNNNPGNIKATASSIKMSGVVGIESTPAADGGNFLIFANPQVGVQAIGQLILNSPGYANMSAEAAIKRYNGGGAYGAATVGLDPKKDFQTQLKDPAVLLSVSQAIAKAEGFTGKTDSSTTPIGATSSSIDTTTKGYTTDIIPKSGGLTQSAIDQAALQYAIDGVLPTGAKTSKGAGFLQSTVIKNRAGQLNAGGNIVANKAQLKALTSTLVQQTEYLSTVERSLQNAEDGFKQVTTAFQNAGLNPSESKFQNSKLNDVRNLFGSNTAARYAFDAGLTEVANEYSQVFSRGGQVTDSVRNRAGSILDGSMSLKDLEAIQTELQSQGAIVKNGSQYQVQKLQDQINKIINPNAKSTVTNSGTTVMTSPDGKQFNVPNDKVDLFKQNGYK